MNKNQTNNEKEKMNQMNIIADVESGTTEEEQKRQKQQEDWSKLMKRWNIETRIKLGLVIIGGVMSIGSLVIILILGYWGQHTKKLYGDEGVKVEAIVTDIDYTIGFRKKGHCVYQDEEGEIIEAQLKANSFFVNEGDVLEGSYLPSDTSMVFCLQDYETTEALVKFFKTCGQIGFFIFILVNIFSIEIIYALDW